MKAVVAAFNQEKVLVGAFSVITNLRICFGWNFLKHYSRVFAASGQTSGGVCENCQHNTEGKNCEICIPGYYQVIELETNPREV